MNAENGLMIALGAALVLWILWELSKSNERDANERARKERERAEELQKRLEDKH